jgi:phosphatidylserine/phosphatidylglycerophosphate/cardiolipin synthase-like enzyme
MRGTHAFWAGATLLVLAACGPGGKTSESQTDSHTKAVLSPRPEPGVYSNATESPLLDLIDSSKETLDVEIYEIREPVVHAALRRALSRDVAVRVIVEPSTVGGDCKLAFQNDGKLGGENCGVYLDALADLQAAGAEIKPFPKTLCGGDAKTCVEHGKLVVADGKTALVSTGNFNASNLCSLTPKASRCNRDFSVIVDDEPSVRALAAVFAHDFTAESYDVNAVLAQFPGHRLTVSPVSAPELFAFLGEAKSSLALQAQYLKDPSLNEVLTEIAQSGVQVRATVASACSFGPMTEKESAKVAGTMQPLVDAGIDVKMFTTRNVIAGKQAYMHSKVFVVDRAKAWVGSTNGSRQAIYANREFGVFLEDPKDVEKLLAVVDADHDSEANEELADNLNCLAEFGGLSGDKHAPQAESEGIAD